MSEDWPKSWEIFPFYQCQEMDLSLLSDLFLLGLPFSKLPSPLPTPGCVLYINFPILVVLENTICPKTFANPGIESLPPPVAAKSCWWDLEWRDFPWWGTVHRSTHPVAPLCHWLFPIKWIFWGYPGQAVLSLWLKPLFEGLWGGFGSDSILCSPRQGVDAEGLMSQAWLKDGRQVPHWGLLHPLPGDNPDQWLLSHCSTSPQLDDLLSFCLLELHLELGIH